MSTPPSFSQLNRESEAKPRITVGILTYNSERTLHQCLSAIFSQGYGPDEIEVLVSDAGSKDRTVEIAAQFGVQVFSDLGRSRGKGRNFFVQTAKSEILVMVDSDEILPPDWLSTVERLLAASDVAEATGPYYTPEPNLGLVGKVIYNLTSGWEFSSKKGRRRADWP